MIKSASILLLCALIGLNGTARQPATTADAPTGNPAAAAAFNAPSAAQYIENFVARMNAGGISCRTLSEDDPFTLIINASIMLEVIQLDGVISEIDITAQGDGSALSGEVITEVMAEAVRAYSPAGLFRVKDSLLNLISQTSGEDTVAGLKLSLNWSAESLELTLSPTDETQEAMPSPPPMHTPSSVSELIAHMAMLLPEGWTQTSYQGEGAQADVLLNIYTTSEDPDELWECARTLLTRYWQSAKEQSLDCGRLSLVFYSGSMAPLLSLGISRADALGSKVLIGNPTSEQLIAELERLASESDALVVKHYDASEN